MQLVRHQCLERGLLPPAAASPPRADAILSRAPRARLGWQERLARNARGSTAGPGTIRRFGVPTAVAASLGLATAGLGPDSRGEPPAFFSRPVWNSRLLLSRLVHAPSRRVDRLFQTSRPVLPDVRLSLNVSLFHTLAAHPVGRASC
jgi:hypothetical protein